MFLSNPPRTERNDKNAVLNHFKMLEASINFSIHSVLIGFAAANPYICIIVCCFFLSLLTPHPHPPILIPCNSDVPPLSLFSLSLPAGRKSLTTICLAVMNSEPFRTNHLGQINETLQGDKLCVCARVCVSKILYNPWYHLTYAAVTDSVLLGKYTRQSWRIH